MYNDIFHETRVGTHAYNVKNRKVTTVSVVKDDKGNDMTGGN